MDPTVEARRLRAQLDELNAELASLRPRPQATPQRLALLRERRRAEARIREARANLTKAGAPELAAAIVDLHYRLAL